MPGSASDTTKVPTKVLSVVGARPQFVKLAPVARAAADAGVEHVVVHTGQHYDEEMSGSFFDELGIPAPALNLGVGSGSHGVQTSAILAALEPVLTEQRPDWVLVYGDTNSTLAAAVCAVKLHLPLAHLEAGLRSHNRRMPEEHNRVLTDHAADLCLAPTDVAMAQLTLEGLSDRARMVGDVMVDVLLETATQVADQPVSSPIEDDSFVLATVHRAENTDDPAQLGAILTALAGLPLPVRLAAHPRLRARVADFGLTLEQGAIRAVDPLSYRQLVQALSRAHAVVTDSGGLQKEAFVLGVPTVTLRTETEWPETLAGGWNVLCPDPVRLADRVGRPAPTSARGAPYGDGHAAGRVIRALVDQRPGETG